MKKQISRTIAFLLVIAMALATGACSSSQPQNTTTAPAASPASSATDSASASAASATSAPPAGNSGSQSALAKYDPPITVTTVFTLDPTVKFRTGESITNNVWIKGYADKLGINLQYMWIANDATAWAQKFNTMIASGGLPDIMQVGDPIIFKQLMSSDALADLTPYQSVKGPRTLEGESKLGAYGESIAAEVTKDGKLYAWPNWGTGLLDNSPMLYLRQDWLDSNGWTAPTTMDELNDLLVKFTKNDPDKDGKADTVGLSLDKVLFGGSSVLDGYFNGYGAFPGVIYKKADGTITDGDIDAGCKDALAALAKLYADGAIDHEFITNDYTELVAKGMPGAAFGMMWNGIWPLNMTVEKNNKASWVAYPAVFNTGVDPKVSGSCSIAWYGCARKGYEHPEVVYKLVEFSLEMAYGSAETAEQYQWAKDGIEVFKYGLLRTVAFGSLQNSYLNVNDALKTGDSSKLNGEDLAYYNNCVAFKGGQISGFGHWTTFGSKGSQGVLIGYKDKNMTVQSLVVGAPVEAMSTYGSSLTDLRNQTFTKIITGELPISAFDDYVKQWKSIGGDKVLADLQQKYGNK